MDCHFTEFMARPQSRAGRYFAQSLGIGIHELLLLGPLSPTRRRSGLDGSYVRCVVELREANGGLL